MSHFKNVYPTYLAENRRRVVSSMIRSFPFIKSGATSYYNNSYRINLSHVCTLWLTFLKIHIHQFYGSKAGVPHCWCGWVIGGRRGTDGQISKSWTKHSEDRQPSAQPYPQLLAPLSALTSIATSASWFCNTFFTRSCKRQGMQTQSSRDQFETNSRL